MANEKNLPYIPLYTGDWEKDCNVLSLETEAAWLRIIFKMFNSGKQSVYKIPTKALQNLWRVSEDKMNEILQELSDNDICGIVREDRFIEFTSRRYEKENAISEIRRKAVASRKDRQPKSEDGDTKELQTDYKTDTNDVHNAEIDIEYESDIEDEIVLKEKPQKAEIYSFEEFWDDYDKKTGKGKSEGLWKKISDTDKLLIKDYIPKYKNAQPDKTYRKNPETFLRNKGWEDEIIKSSNYGIQKDRHDRVHEIITQPGEGRFISDI